MIAGPILFLDLATRTGFCSGRRGDKCPRSGSVLLKKPGEHRRIATSNLMAWLEHEFSTNGLPALIATEAPLRLAGFKNQSNSEANVRFQHELQGVVGLVSWRYSLPIPVEANVDSIRKLFMGYARTGRREDTKAAVIRRAQMLGLMPKDSTDDNRADSIAGWEFVCANYAGRIPSELVLFEGRARKARPARA